MVRSNLKLLFIGFAALAAATGFSQNVWTVTDHGVASENIIAQQLLNFSAYRADIPALKQELANAPMENFGPGVLGYEIRLPMPDGRLERFRIHNSPIVSGSAAQQLRGFSTYSGKGVDDPYAVVRLDFGVNGFHGMVLSPKGDVMIDPVSLTDTTNYISYFRRDFTGFRAFPCYTTGQSTKLGGINIFPVVLTTLKTYRLAMNATIEYTNFHGGVAPATTAVGTAVNRVTGVYEKDFGIRLNMTYVKCWTGVDPYTNSNGSAMLGQNQTETDATVGNANYDIGHVFSTGGGGIAQINSVGVTGAKARGVTGLPSPIGDPFYIDYVAHEMGHQYGGNHTWHNCGGGRWAPSAYEPGSGSTIMAYAGICGAQDVQSFSDAYFHTRSFDEIMAWRNNAASGGTSQNTTNNNPIANAGADFAIPTGTPFKLTGSGTDSDGDPLTYCWEQFDLGAIGDNTTQPLFRSRNPSTSNRRFMPQLSTVINNGSDIWEVLPPVNRILTFRCTVRDNRANGGGSAYDTMVITVAGSPFSVTAPNTAVSWPGGSTQTVTWNVGGGGTSANVNILLSTDGGNSYGAGTATMVLANTPNDGSQTITVPSVNSTQCRIIVEAATSIFYDMSNVNFTITPGAPLDVAPDLATVFEGQYISGGLPELATSNDAYYVAGRWKSPAAGPHVQVQVEGTSTRFTTTGIVVRVESKVNVVGTNQSIEAWNFTTNSWVTLDTVAAPTSDMVRTATISTNPAQYIQTGTGKLRLRLGYLETTSFLPRWRASIDQVKWTINP